MSVTVDSHCSHRENALKRLQEITEQFVLNVCERRKVPKETSKHAGGAVFTYGSYKLGVNSAGRHVSHGRKSMPELKILSRC